MKKIVLFIVLLIIIVIFIVYIFSVKFKSVKNSQLYGVVEFPKYTWYIETEGMFTDTFLTLSDKESISIIDNNSQSNKMVISSYYCGEKVYGIFNKFYITYDYEIKEDSKDKNEITYKNITDDEAKVELENDDSIILLDVRTKEEYDEEHIPNSILISVDELESRALNELKDKEMKIFIYCRTGNRSITASNILVNLGYTNVYNLGGIVDWKYEVE